MSGRRSVPRRAGRGVLLIVASLLVASAAVRFGAGPGFAIARDLVSDPPEVMAPVTDRDADITPELVALLNDVKEREDRLRMREEEMAARLEVLALVETEVEQDIQRLEQAEAALRATISVANQAAENDIARLTAVYENMKAEQAATLFQKMEPSFAAGFLGRMRPDAAAAILAGLEPDLAYSISVVLAGRNADVPVEKPNE